MDARIRWAQHELELRLQERLTVDHLARATNLSPSRFAHLFRREVGVSPARYVHTLRMTRARVLIERTFLTVKEVMAQVGFTDPSHFSRDFRRAHGITPRELRGRGWTGCQRHANGAEPPHGIERRSRPGQLPAQSANRRPAHPRRPGHIVDPDRHKRRNPE